MHGGAQCSQAAPAPRRRRTGWRTRRYAAGAADRVAGDGGRLGPGRPRRGSGLRAHRPRDAAGRRAAVPVAAAGHRDGACADAGPARSPCQKPVTRRGCGMGLSGARRARSSRLTPRSSAPRPPAPPVVLPGTGPPGRAAIRPAVPAGLRAAARRGRRRGGRRPGRRGLPAAAGGDLAGEFRVRPLLAQISRWARRAHVEIAGSQPDGPAAPFGLTGRELESVRLVAAGLGNRGASRPRPPRCTCPTSSASSASPHAARPPPRTACTSSTRPELTTPPPPPPPPCLARSGARAGWRSRRPPPRKPPFAASPAYVTSGEHPGELVSWDNGGAVGVPVGARVAEHVRPGEDETPLVTCGALADPFGLRLGADEDEQGVSCDTPPGPGLAVLQHQRLEMTGASAGQATSTSYRTSTFGAAAMRMR